MAFRDLSLWFSLARDDSAGGPNVIAWRAAALTCCAHASNDLQLHVSTSASIDEVLHEEP
jgi:hypothetical protein